ncbi:scavenger receptor cysteine-rich domain superfamily protein-like [Ptychodera flava]|uniref:scavenger receptor cysteine-rich domain superfamily protein-like n=1 Tax=Ptychodera flava TaxID=63121 RepID=UPI00396A2252
MEWHDDFPPEQSLQGIMRTQGSDFTVLCPPDIEVGTDPGRENATVVFPALNITGASKDVTVSSNHENGSQFAIGETVVSFEVTDSLEQTESCSFTVTVVDDEAPSLECPDDIRVANEPGLPTAVVVYPQPNATDNLMQPVTATSEHSSGDTFNIGITVINYTATDDSGNLGWCTFDIEVFDVEVPLLDCPGNVTEHANVGQRKHPIDFVLPTVWDNSLELINATGTYAPGEGFTIGTTVVNITASDSYDNVAWCSFEVTINVDWRLADGMSHHEGRLEVFDNGEYGTVCSIGWDDVDANVVCKELGFDLGVADIFSTPIFGEGSDPISWSNVDCVQDSLSLLDCPISAVPPQCDHSKDVSIKCKSEVRLVGGSRFYEGRVEVYYNGEWGSVSSDGWDLDDAQVVCRELGYGSAKESFSGRNTAGPIWLTQFGCTGDENRLKECPFSQATNGTNDANNGKTAGVACQGLVSLRGNSSHRGQVQVFYDLEWGAVCSEGWDINDAHVVCRELGYSDGALRIFEETHSLRKIWMSGVDCEGYETTVFHCKTQSPFSSITSCSGNRYAGVECQDKSVRLVGGSTPYEGRVEVLIDNEWGTVYRDWFDSNAADVVCKQLGFSLGQRQVSTTADFGEGTGQTCISDMYCGGSETSLLDCKHKKPAVCDHAFDAGVVCEGVVRLHEEIKRSVNGSYVEVYSESNWLSVADTYWSKTNADIVCRELGYLFGAAQDSCITCPLTTNQQIDAIQCTGIESSVKNCRHESGSFSSDAASTVCSVPELTLIDGYTPYQGRLLINYGETSGRVCARSWTNSSADVVCRQLFGAASGSEVLLPPSLYGITSGSPILLDNVDCLGHEKSIAFCPSLRRHDSVDSGESCDVAVHCKAPFRLVSGDYPPNEGRVEVYMNDKWGRVLNSKWDEEDAEVLCRELGFPAGANIPTDVKYPNPASSEIFMNNIECEEDETYSSLLTCPYDAKLATQDAVVQCAARIELTGGYAYNDGYLRVYLNGQWGEVCSEGFTNIDGNVTCNGLGFPGVSLISFRKRNSFVWMSNVDCKGNEKSILDCHYPNRECNSDEHVYLICEPRVRLVDMDVPYNGYVEVYSKNKWWPLGEYHDTSIRNGQPGYSRQTTDYTFMATVICKELGEQI